MPTVHRSQSPRPSTAVGSTAGSGRGRLPSGSEPAVSSLFSSWRALVAACVILWRRTRSADAVVFLALNPLTAFYLVNGGRNDMLVGLALLGAVVLAARDRTTAAGLVGGLGALVKLTGMVGVVAIV